MSDPENGSTREIPRSTRTRLLLVRAHVGGGLLLADVQRQVSGALVDAHDLPFVDLRPGADKHLAPLLGTEERVGRGGSILKGHLQPQNSIRGEYIFQLDPRAPAAARPSAVPCRAARSLPTMGGTQERK